jgi:hypothetical protein
MPTYAALAVEGCLHCYFGHFAEEERACCLHHWEEGQACYSHCWVRYSGLVRDGHWREEEGLVLRLQSNRAGEEGEDGLHYCFPGEEGLRVRCWRVEGSLLGRCFVVQPDEH